MFIILFVNIMSISATVLSANTALLNVCLDSQNHKIEPGPEGYLYKQCSPWKDWSCCSLNTTHAAHHTNLYGFNIDHCAQSKKMSSECRKHFMQDLCFYECSPNIGPWVVKVSDMKIRNERFFEVPLCQSDCEAWFESCFADYTCTDNWSRNFKWNNSRNECPDGSTCRTFAQVYGSAENFCSKVWDHSWKSVPDTEPCMRLWFNPEGGNPNEKVARYYASLITNMASSVAFNCSKTLLITLILIVLSKLF